MTSVVLEALQFYGLDDFEFNQEIFELQNGHINFNYDRLNSLNYILCFQVQTIVLSCLIIWTQIPIL